MMEKQQEKLTFLTELRALACIAIVFLHTFYAASAFASDFSEQVIALTVRNLMMWAVPCFVMITGTLLLNESRSITYRKLFQKYILRMIVALLLFSVLFEILDTIAAKEPFRISTIFLGLKNAATGKSWKHLWYLYLMIGLYLLLPFYRKIAATLNRKDTCYLIGVYLVFLSILPMLETLTEIKTAFYICVYSVYPLYLFLGYALYCGLLQIPRWVQILFAVIGTISVVVLTFLSEKLQLKSLSDLLTNYAFPLIVLQSIGIFGLMRAKKAKTPHWLEWILEQIDSCSFGIYLIHMAFLKAVLVYLQWNPYAHGGTMMVLLLALAVTILSFGCIWALKKIPGLKKLL